MSTSRPVPSATDIHAPNAYSVRRHALDFARRAGYLAPPKLLGGPALMSLILSVLALSSALTLADTHPLRAGDTYYGYGTSARLGDLFDFDYYFSQELSCKDVRGETICTVVNNPADEHGLCFIGQAGQNRVCAVLSELSRNDVAAYESGDHALTK